MFVLLIDMFAWVCKISYKGAYAIR